MNKTTTEYYKMAIKRALSARELISDAKEKYAKECGIAKGAFDARLLGETGYRERLAELEKSRDAEIEGALGVIDAVSAEYTSEMKILGHLDGSKIDSGTMALLNSGLVLTNEDWQELADTYKDNHVMTRILRERYNANKPKSEWDGLTLGQKNTGRTFGQFGQSPQDRAENFNMFTQLLRYNAISDIVPNEGRVAYTSKVDYWNHCARESIRRMQPFGDESFDSLEQDFPVEYVQAKQQSGNLTEKQAEYCHCQMAGNVV